jgi:hypothetical protein
MAGRPTRRRAASSTAPRHRAAMQCTACSSAPSSRRGLARQSLQAAAGLVHASVSANRAVVSTGRCPPRPAGMGSGASCEARADRHQHGPKPSLDPPGAGGLRGMTRHVIGDDSASSTARPVGTADSADDSSSDDAAAVSESRPKPGASSLRPIGRSRHDSEPHLRRRLGLGSVRARAEPHQCQTRRRSFKLVRARGLGSV